MRPSEFSECGQKAGKNAFLCGLTSEEIPGQRQKKAVPLEGLEPPTVSLGRNCSSIELQRLASSSSTQGRGIRPSSPAGIATESPLEPLRAPDPISNRFGVNADRRLRRFSILYEHCRAVRESRHGAARALDRPDLPICSCRPRAHREQRLFAGVPNEERLGCTDAGEAGVHCRPRHRGVHLGMMLTVRARCRYRFRSSRPGAEVVDLRST